MCRLEAIFKYAPATVTALVAICVAFIAYRQWRTAQEKLRLDLYNRRFEIYSSILDFYNELLVWSGTDDQIALQMPFMKAFRESRFLFSKSSGVYRLLEDFNKHAMVITTFENLKPVMSSLGVEGGTKQFNKRMDSVTWIGVALEPLEQKMAPYLDFHKI